MIRVVVFSECNSCNLGDQAIAQALRSILSKDYVVKHAYFGTLVDERFSCADHQSSTSKPFSILDFAKKIISGKFKALVKWYLLGERNLFLSYYSSAIIDCDLAIIGGGQLIKNNLDLFCNKLALIGKASRERSLPLGLVAVGVDKALAAYDWSFIADALLNSRFTLTRDSTSCERIRKRLPGMRPCASIPDVAFALHNTYYNNQCIDRKVELAFNVMCFDSLRLALGRSNVISGKSYSRILAAFIGSGELNSHSCELFTTGSVEDLVAAKQLQVALSQLGYSLNVYHPRSLDALLRYLSSVERVLAMRMHAGILSYVSGCNPLCINWDDKVMGVWSLLGQSERVIEVADLARADFPIEIGRRFERNNPASPDDLYDLRMNVAGLATGYIDSYCLKS